MKKILTIVAIILFIGLVGGLIYMFISKDDDQTTEDVQDESSVETIDQDESEDTNDDTTTETDEEDTTTDNTSNDTTTDFSSFSAELQQVGTESSSNKYIIEPITNEAMSGYHRIHFPMTYNAGEKVAPFVTAKYRSDLNSIRVDLNGIADDNSGIGYQQAVNINKDGVIKIFHNVSSDQTEELYDVGVSKSTIFKLSVVNKSDTQWDIILDVKYPGTVENSSTSSTNDYSKNKQTVNGATSAEGALLSEISYTTGGGVFKLSWNVKGSSSKPYPSAYAEYEGNKLVITFPDLQKDYTASYVNSVEFQGSPIEAVVSGKQSKYYITMSSPKDFRINGTQSPNQIVVEIKYK